jgi:hypothetical protein
MKKIWGYGLMVDHEALGSTLSRKKEKKKGERGEGGKKGRKKGRKARRKEGRTEREKENSAFVVMKLGIKPRASHMLGKALALGPQP